MHWCEEVDICLERVVACAGVANDGRSSISLWPEQNCLESIKSSLQKTKWDHSALPTGTVLSVVIIAHQALILD